MSRQETAALVHRLVRRRAVMAGSTAVPEQAARLPTDLSAVDWHGVIRLASAHFVLAALAPALATADRGEVPDAVMSFLAGITRANAARNGRLLGALEAIGERLAVQGIEATVLKGAAFLAAAPATGADWRFMQDIDLLVAEERLAPAVASLTALGYRATTSDYDPATEAHYPPLTSPCGAFAVELHTRLFGLGDHGLPTAEIRREALPVSIGSARLSLPSTRHRIGHLLLHAQVHNRFFAARRIVLKDLLDLAMLDHAAGALPEGAVDGPIADTGAREPARALVEAWAAWARAGMPDAPRPGPWGRAALARIGWSRWHSWAAMPGDIARLELHRWRSEPGHAARRLATAKSPARLARTAADWSGKQRQRLWG